MTTAPTALPPLYIYQDEDGDAVALAFWTKGPNGGDVGRDIARMSIPRKGMTQDDVNAWAAAIVRAVNAHDALVLALSWLAGLIMEKPHDAAEQMPLAIAAANAALARAKEPQA